jgi:hypothetical protein
MTVQFSSAIVTLKSNNAMAQLMMKNSGKRILSLTKSNTYP